MKKILFCWIFLNTILSFSQDNQHGTDLVEGIIPINRKANNEKPNIENSNYSVNNIAPSSPTGNSNEVGVTEGELSVSLTGGASYNIPIAVPSGLNGVVPQISLTYNSQGGNGTAGYGWNISGISVITRVPSTKFHDNNIDGVDFDALDRFSLDGQRLIVKTGTSGVYGSDNTVYETESFSNVKITSYGTHPSGANYGPAYFIVQYPDGSIAHYGNSTNSRSLTDWAITHWQNPQGVGISYTYLLSNNNLSVSKVRYGAKLTSTQINEIEFIYGTRNRSEQAYIGGLSFIRNTILKEIKVKGNAVGFRNYLLTHETTSLGYERLKSITEKSGDNTKSFNPTIFNYDETNNNNLFSLNNSIGLNINDINALNSEYVSGDFDGDGRMEFILFPIDGPDNKKKYWIFNGLQDGNSNIGSEHAVGPFLSIFSTSWLNHAEKLMPMNGWCVVKNNGNLTNFDNYSKGVTNSVYFQYTRQYEFPKMTYGYMKYPCDPGNQTPIHSGLNENVEYNSNSPTWTIITKDIPKEYLSGDFNGDGLTDVLIVEKTFKYPVTNYCETTDYTYSGGNSYFLNLDRRLTSNFINYANTVIVTLDSKFQVADIDGDGKSDLLIFDSSIIKIYSLNESNQLVLKFNYSDVNINLDMPRYMGDFNGDGKLDFLIPQQLNVDNWFFFFSKGNGFQKVTTGIGFPYKTSNVNWFIINGVTTQCLEEVTFIANDLNGDGKTDILLQGNYTGASTGDSLVTLFRIFENKGFNGSSISFNQVYVNAQIGGIKRYPLPVFLDHNKYNQNLEYGLISDNAIRLFRATKDNRIDTRLKEIIIGNGNKHVITYSSLNAVCYNSNNCNIAFEPSTYSEIFPNYDIQQADGFQVVSKLEQITSTSEYKRQTFKYYGAVSNTEGLGFLGFRGLLRTNWHDDNYPIISSVSKHDILKRGAIYETFTVTGNLYGNFTNNSPINFINKVNMIYEDELLANKVYKIKNTFTISKNGLEDTTSEKETIYDSFNNPISTILISKSGSTIERTENIVLEYYPISSGTTYYVGRLKKKNATVTHNGDTKTGEEIYTYNAAHLISKIQKKGHQTNYLTEDNIYDTFGNIIKKTITAVGLTPRVTNYTYDVSGRFLITSKDVEGLVTSFTYNTNNGLLLTKTLPSNTGFPLITSYFYDVWGKKIRETDYLNKNINITYNWLSSPFVGGYSIQTIGEDGSLSSIWNDNLGRKIAEGYRTINDSNANESNMSWQSLEYDIYDRIIKSYESVLSETPQWSGIFSSTTFDGYGRAIEIKQSTGNIINIEYNGLTVVSTDGTANSSVTKNSFGATISKSDNGGTIIYQYYADGNLKQSNFNGNSIDVYYDGWGKKIRMFDPNVGTYRYEYNEFGELIKEISPKGITTFLIDNFGKVLEKNIVGTGGDPTNTQTRYTYNPITKLLTNTRYEDFTGGFYTLYSYSYDDYKRLDFYDESGFNAYYQRAIKYDIFGRPESELYTAINTSDNRQSSKWIKNTYQNGHHWQIIDDETNQILWQSTKVNAKGQLTEGNFGNGISVSNTYDQYGFPTQFRHDKTTNPTANVLTLTTYFEPQRGNLLSRKNNMFDFSENFDFDELDRLIQWQQTETLWDCNFSATLHGFQSVNSATVNLSSGRMAVSGSVGTSGRGVQKLVISNATVGKKVSITGKLKINSASFNTTFHLSFYTKNPLTGATMGYSSVGVQIVDGIFTHETTITSSDYQDLYVMFLMRNPSNPSATMSLTLDDIKISLIDKKRQTYDSMGRIDENNVGIYNYTNTISSTGAAKYFQNSSIETYPEFTNYYTNRANLDITYNVFKSPINIIEEGKDKLSFIYNMNNNRSTMYYGGLEADKLERRYRKHYAADGSMEIKQDFVNGTIEFITYIGGDAYSAPIMLKSDGETQNYLYLHRDYLGSIIAITNQTANVVEKRLFDAWGNVIKVQDGAGNNLNALTVLERGYTGHEHLQGVNLIHMNGRLYDPVIYRFLQPDNFVQDPSNTQNFNRYSYVLNNPLKYSDPSGEIHALVVAAIIGAIAGAAGYIAHSIQTGDWSWSGFGMAVIGGAAVGALTGGLSGASATCVTLSTAGNTALSSFAGAFFPPVAIPIGDWTLSVSPAIAFGNANGSGVSFGVSYSDGDWSFSGGVGVMSYSNYNGFGANANEVRYSALVNYDDGKTGFSLGTNFWRGDFKQQTGVAGFRSGDWNVTYENDGAPFSGSLGDGEDRRRTAAMKLGYKDFSLGFKIFTGDRILKGENEVKHERGFFGRIFNKVPKGIDGGYGANLPFGAAKEKGVQYRLGVGFIGYKNYQIGINSYRYVGHPIQNIGAHFYARPQVGFTSLSNNINPYFQYKTFNQFTIW